MDIALLNPPIPHLLSPQNFIENFKSTPPEKLQAILARPHGCSRHGCNSCIPLGKGGIYVGRMQIQDENGTVEYVCGTFFFCSVTCIALTAVAEGNA